jgi:NAD(P)-dependent dehydrogenase (short-subunit alcohol dehydrogenase family)
MSVFRSVPDFSAAQAQEIASRYFGVAGDFHALPSERDQNYRITCANGDIHILKIGMFYLCREAIAGLRQDGGVIVNIASDAGLTGSRDLVAYRASKGALIQMSRAMALDHGAEGVRVIALCPGDVDTPMLRGEFVQRGVDAVTGLRESAQGVPLNRVCSADEVADLVLYAASDSARFMTGYPLVIDGGSRA